MKLKSGAKKVQRQKNALKRLESQLKKGTKTTKLGEEKLTDSDKERISREMEILTVEISKSL
jgi:hypothetical protein